jgi:hypothetical protein
LQQSENNFRKFSSALIFLVLMPALKPRSGRKVSRQKVHDQIAQKKVTVKPIKTKKPGNCRAYK